MNAPLLALHDLVVTYRGDLGDVPALGGIDLDLFPGERLAVIGESGSGKSTLALAIAGLLPQTARVTGSVEWPALKPQSPTTHPVPPPPGLKSTFPGRIPQNGRDIGFVFQDPAGSLDPVMAVGQQVAEVVQAHLGLDRPAAEERARDLLGRVRLPDPASAFHAFPHQLSGGQKQRVAVAAAIAAGPRLLIADEATSALDTIVQAEIVALLKRLVAEDGMALLFVTHDIALASGLADRIAVLRHGALVETGDTRDIVERPAHPYTRSLLDAHIGLDAVPLLTGGYRP